jgi:hypothetical protein
MRSSHAPQAPRLDAVLHQLAIGADARLPTVAVLGEHGAFHCRVDVGVIEDDERGVAAESSDTFLTVSAAPRIRCLPTAAEPVN